MNIHIFNKSHISPNAGERIKKFEEKEFYYKMYSQLQKRFLAYDESGKPKKKESLFNCTKICPCCGKDLECVTIFLPPNYQKPYAIMHLCSLDNNGCGYVYADW